ncbi:MAG: ABC transporter ATP-binding protein [bacterium]|nr:ABC transporter ATP-binding protein [bacterium]
MNFFKNLKITWKFARKEKKNIILFIFFSILSILVSIIVPVLSAKSIIALTDSNFYQLILMSIIIFIMELSRNLITYMIRKTSQIIYRQTFTDLEIELGTQILKLQNEVIDNNSSGVFIQRLTNDTSRISDVFFSIITNLTTIICDIGIFVVIFIINRIVFLYLILMTILIYIIEYIRVNKYNEKDKIFRKESERVSGFIGEIVRGSKDIKMLNAESSFLFELKDRMTCVNKTRYNQQTVNRNYIMLRGSIIDLKDLLLTVLLVYLIMDGHLQVASALVIHNYSTRVTNIIYYIGELLECIKDFNLSSNRIFDIIYSEEFGKESFGSFHLDNVNGDFEFKNVYFSYGENKVLKDLSFKIKANETVAFVGKSGAGKTTIFNLLCKMYDVDRGEITIDGVDIKKLDKDSIRGNITIISQNPYVFNLSIKDNLKLVKNDLTESEMIKACKDACLHDFIVSLPDGYNTIIGEGGVNLSGGQKQRLAIARALIQKTEIMLFDEATSALDNETQSSIKKAIDNMKKDYTILIIAHRLSTIINSDRILFLSDGKILAEGSHKKLLQENEEYKKLYELELMKE